MSVLKKNGLSHENKNSDEHIIPGGADSIEHALIQKLLTESSIGIFTYHFKDQSFKSSDSLRNLLSECLPDNTISAENLINNTVTEDKNFLVDLFTLPKPGRKKVSGQFIPFWGKSIIIEEQILHYINLHTNCLIISQTDGIF